MRPVNFDINDLIESLNGTCNSLDSALPEGMEYDDLTTEDHAEIDANIFCCATCGWWCEIGGANSGDDGDVCGDCVEDDGDDDEIY